MLVCLLWKGNKVWPPFVCANALAPYLTRFGNVQNTCHKLTLKQYKRKRWLITNNRKTRFCYYSQIPIMQNLTLTKIFSCTISGTPVATGPLPGLTKIQATEWLPGINGRLFCRQATRTAGNAVCMQVFYALNCGKKTINTVFVILFVPLLLIASVFCYFCVNALK